MCEVLRQRDRYRAAGAAPVGRGTGSLARRSSYSIATVLPTLSLTLTLTLVTAPSGAAAANGMAPELPSTVGSRASSVQITPDGGRVLISKDVQGPNGLERWAITHNRDEDGTVTGNVYPADGGPPTFLFCTQSGEDAGDLLLECLAAGACLESPCTRSQWTELGTVRVPASFLEPPGPNVSELPEDAPLRFAPQSLIIDGRTIVLEVDELRRDYLTSGNPLMVRIRLVTTDSSPFPADVAINRIWVINDTLVWETPPVPDPSTRDDPPPWAIEVYSTGGPQWGPTLSDPTTPLVTPVVRLRRGNQEWLLRGTPSPIEITV